MFYDEPDYDEIESERRDYEAEYRAEAQAESDTAEDHRRFPWLSEDWQDERTTP